MSTTSVTPPPPPPPAVIYGGGVHHAPSQYSSSPSSSSIITVITIIVSAVIVSASIYLLLRYISRRFQPSFSAEDGSAIPGRAASSNQQQRHVAPGDLIHSLPLFTFSSVTPSVAAGGDCAVCLSKFEQHDQLRLLPLCCHAFHAACIDTWIVSNQTCPLCRSTVLPSSTVLFPQNRGKIANGLTDGGGSFRIEIGNISRRHARTPETETADSEPQRQSYSVGAAFEYIVGEDNALEVSVGHTTHSRRLSDMDSNKSSVEVSMPPGEVLDAQVSSGRNRLRECVDRLASISSAISFRSSGRFSSGSSHRNEAAAIVDLEAYRAGEEISEIFRWLSGV